MARRQSYFAASNKGKAGSVFVNNMIAGMEADASKRKKEAAAGARKAAADQKRREREREKRYKQAAREEARREKIEAREKAKQAREREKTKARAKKERERQQKLEAKEKEKFDKLLERVKLICTKHDIPTNMAQEIAEKGFEADVTPTKIEGDVILPELRYWQVEGVLQSLGDAEEITRDDYRRFRSKMCDSDVPHTEILSQPELDGMRNHKLILDEIERIEDGELVAEDDLKILKGATTRRVSLDEFKAANDVDALFEQKKRYDALDEIAEKETMLEEDLETFSSYVLSNKIPVADFKKQDNFLEFTSRKEKYDDTNSQLDKIFENHELHLDDYTKLETYALENFMVIEDVKSDATFQKFRQIKQDDVQKLEELEQEFSLDTLRSNSPERPLPGNPRKEKVQFEKNIESIEIIGAAKYYFGMLWRVFPFGFLGTHRFYSGRTLTGFLMLLVFILLSAYVVDIDFVKDTTHEIILVWLDLSISYDFPPPPEEEAVWGVVLGLWWAVDIICTLFGLLKNKDKKKAVI
jgi:hypothetical protein